MGILMALQRQTISIPVSNGLDTKTDSKQVMEGSALVLENARFQKTGKLSKRFGQTKLSITTSENDLTTYNLKAVVSDNDYLAVQSDEGIFGFSYGEDSWQKQNSYGGGANAKINFIAKNHLAHHMTDQDTTDDGQFSAFICAQVSISTPFYTLSSYSLTLKDNTTGLIKSATFSGGFNYPFCRVLCVKVSGQVKIHVFYYDGTNIVRQILDDDLDFGVTTTIITSFPTDPNNITPFISQFDVCKNSNTIFFVKASSNSTALVLKSYDYSGLALNSVNYTMTNSLGINNRGLTCTYAHNKLHIAWTGNNAVVLLGRTSALASSVAEYKITTTIQPYEISVCGVTTGGSTNIFVAWNESSISSNTISNKIGHVEVAYTTTYSPLYSFNETSRLRLSSQLFNINDKIFTIASEYDVISNVNYPQNNSYFLFNITENIIAQTFSPALSYSMSDLCLPKVTNLSGVVRTNIRRFSSKDLDVPTTYDNQSEFILDFNYSYKDNTRVRVGDRFYLCNGSLIELDKSNPHDNGFQFSPSFIVANKIAGTPDPDLVGKNFSYCAIYEYYDSEGNITRSAPSYIVSTGVIPANINAIQVNVASPIGSLKYNQVTGRQPVAVIYRTANLGSVFYRVGEISINNDGTTSSSFADTTPDTSLTKAQTLYTTGDVLQNDPAPSAVFCFSGGNRIFLGGLEEKDEIAYSKQQLFGESVNFSDLFRIRVSSGSLSDKTPISAGGYMDGKIVIFRNQSIYFSQGDGPNEVGIGDFSNPEIISSDVGCTDPKSVLNTPMGLMFKSRKGIYLLDRGMTVQYIGAPVEDFNSYNVVASSLSDKYNEARFYLSNGVCLVYNYLFQTWSSITNQTSFDSDIWQGLPVVIRGNAVYKETENFYKDDTTYYSMKFVSPWLKLGNLQGYQRVYQLWILGDYKSAHTLKCKVYVDYDDSVFEEYSLVYNSSSSPQYQFQISLPIQKVESMKFEIYDASQSGNGESFDLSGIQVEVGMKAGGYKLAANKSY
jgi:hypothetical protein